MNNALEGIDSRITQAEEQICDIEDRQLKSLHKTEYRKKNEKKKKDSLRDLWDNIKHTNMCIIQVPEGGGEREKEPMKIFEEIITENVPNREREWSTKSRKHRQFPAG